MSGPRPLFITTEMWLSTARQCMAMAALGCEVLLLAPAKHPALLTRAVRDFYRHRPLRPVQRILQVVLEVRPNAIIPADERTVIHLQELWLEAEADRSTDGTYILDLLRKSLGSRDALFAARSRMQVLQLALEEGVAIPETIGVDKHDDITSAVEKLGLPLVLKADMTSGGDGVHIVHDLPQAQKSWKKLHQPPNLARVLRRGILFKNWAHLRSWTQRETLAITAQKFVPGGVERTSMAVCVNGRVLASACLEVAKTWQIRGPSSVLRVVEDESMKEAIERVAARLQLSGFCGFDFMVTEDGRSLLIEMNPRPTQTAHLALRDGRDLIAAYFRGVLGYDVADRPVATIGDTIALFPQELIRDPQSPFIQNAHHDVPWESPELMRFALQPLPAIITDDPRWHAR